MKTRAVVYSKTAREDLVRIQRWLAATSSLTAAFGIVDDLQDFIERLDVASERGNRRDDLAAGIRIVAHGRSQIAVFVEDEVVTIARIFYGGENWETELKS